MRQKFEKQSFGKFVWEGKLVTKECQVHQSENLKIVVVCAWNTKLTKQAEKRCR